MHRSTDVCSPHVNENILNHRSRCRKVFLRFVVLSRHFTIVQMLARVTLFYLEGRRADSGATRKSPLPTRCCKLGRCWFPLCSVRHQIYHWQRHHQHERNTLFWPCDHVSYSIHLAPCFVQRQIVYTRNINDRTLMVILPGTNHRFLSGHEHDLRFSFYWSELPES